MDTFLKDVALALAAGIKANLTTIETALGPLNTAGSNDIIAVAKEVVAKMPSEFAGIGAILDGFIATYGAQLPAFMAKEEGYGLSDLAAWLQQIGTGSTSG